MSDEKFAAGRAVYVAGCNQSVLPQGIDMGNTNPG